MNHYRLRPVADVHHGYPLVREGPYVSDIPRRINVDISREAPGGNAGSADQLHLPPSAGCQRGPRCGNRDQHEHCQQGYKTASHQVLPSSDGSSACHDPANGSRPARADRTLPHPAVRGPAADGGIGTPPTRRPTVDVHRARRAVLARSSANDPLVSSLKRAG